MGIKELNRRFKLISEYNYYVKKNSGKDVLDEQGEDENLEDLESKAGLADDSDNNDGDNDSDLNVDAEDPEIDMQIDDLDDSESNEGEIEVDVSDLVSKQEETAQKIDDLESKFNNIDKTFDDYLQKMFNKSDSIIKRINDLGKNISNELKKRNPTPNEQIQLQSLHSFPFNKKISDYWTPKDGESEYPDMDQSDYSLNVKKGGKKEETPEFILTQQDIEDGSTNFNFDDLFS